MDLLETVNSPTEVAVKHFIDVILCRLSPKIQELDSLMKKSEASQLQQLKDVHMLCNDQILKCAKLMTEIFKLEIQHSETLQDTRHWVFDRINCCLEKLDNVEASIKSKFEQTEQKEEQDSNNFLSNLSNKSFIEWVDDTVTILESLESLFEQDLKAEVENFTTDWRKEGSLNFIKFHKTIKELILSAANIYQICPLKDQQVINARCHVILRESKNFFAEILNDPLDNFGEVQNADNIFLMLKENIHKPTVCMFIHLLKDAVYNLETSVNKAVLGLVLKCLGDPILPLQNLKKNKNSTLKCISDTDCDLDYIDKFDIHNEQIIQIGLFAISCSADVQRVLQLKSCLASIETLEDHLVPSLLSDLSKLHVNFLTDNWSEEVLQLRSCVFLIIDPGAFIDLAVGQMQENIISLKKIDDLNQEIINNIINLGKCVSDFFHAYFTWEPLIFQEMPIIKELIENLDIAKQECVAVVDLFLTRHLLNAKQQQENTTKREKILKRLKLLYTLVLKISKVLNDENSAIDNDDSEESLASMNQNTSNAISNTKHDQVEKKKGILKVFDLFKNQNEINSKGNHKIISSKSTMVNKNNVLAVNKTYSRSTIMRATYTEKTRRFMHYLNEIDDSSKIIPFDGLVSISGFLDETNKDFLLANISSGILNETIEKNSGPEISVNVKNRSNFYNGGKSKTRNTSLRRRVLLNRANEAQNNKCDYLPVSISNSIKNNTGRSIASLNSSLDLHITDILEQITKLSDTISLLKIDHTIDNENLFSNENKLNVGKNVLQLKINDDSNITPKKVWNIKIADDTNKLTAKGKENIMSLPKLYDDTIDCGIDISFASNESTQERINDINILEQKLAKLKASSCKK